MALPFVAQALAALAVGGGAGYLKEKGRIKSEADELERRAVIDLMSKAIAAGRPEALASPETVKLLKKHGLQDLAPLAQQIAVSPWRALVAGLISGQGGAGQAPGGFGQPLEAAPMRPTGQPLPLGPLGVPGAAPALPDVPVAPRPAVREEAPAVRAGLPRTATGQQLGTEVPPALTMPPTPAPAPRAAPLEAIPGAARPETAVPAGGPRLARREPEPQTALQRFFSDPQATAFFFSLQPDEQSQVVKEVLTNPQRQNLTLPEQLQLVQVFTQTRLPPGVTATVGRQGTSFQVGQPAAPVETMNDLNAALTQLFGQGAAASPTPEQVTAARALLRHEAALMEERKTRADVLARREAELDRELSPAEAQQLIQPGTLRSAAAASVRTGRQAREQGFVQASPEQMKAIGEVEDTARLLEGLDALSAQAITAQTRGQAVVGAPQKYLSGYLGFGVEGLYQSNKLAYLGNLSRNLGGERGVLTNQDIARMGAVFPGFLNTATEREAMFSFIRLFSDAAVEGKKRILAGEDPATARKALRPKIEAILDRMGAPKKPPSRTERAARLKREAPTLSQEQLAEIIAREELATGGP